MTIVLIGQCLADYVGPPVVPLLALLEHELPQKELGLTLGQTVRYRLAQAFERLELSRRRRMVVPRWGAGGGAVA